MIMERELLDEYCTWLFDILFELSKRVDMSYLSGFQGRFYGRISEIIFNVWLDQKIQSGEIKKRPGNGDSVYSYGKNQRVEKRNIFPESQILWKKI